MVAREFTRYQKSFKLLDWDSRSAQQTYPHDPPQFFAIAVIVILCKDRWLRSDFVDTYAGKNYPEAGFTPEVVVTDGGYSKYLRSDLRHQGAARLHQL